MHGPSFQDPTNFMAFVKALDLPYDVAIVPKAPPPTMRNWIDPDTGELRYGPLEEAEP